MAKKLVKVDGKYVCYSKSFCFLVDDADQATDFKESDNFPDGYLNSILTAAIKDGGKVEVVFQPDVKSEAVDTVLLNDMELKTGDIIQDKFQWIVMFIGVESVSLMSKYPIGVIPYATPTYSDGHIQYLPDWECSFIKSFCGKNLPNIVSESMLPFVNRIRIPTTDELNNLPTEIVCVPFNSLNGALIVRSYWALVSGYNRAIMVDAYGNKFGGQYLHDSRGFRPVVVLDLKAMDYLKMHRVDQVI